MADKQYYVKITFEYGVDNGDGTYSMKNEGQASWVSMQIDTAIVLQTYAVIPALNSINTKAGELGLIGQGMDIGKISTGNSGNSGK